MALAQRSPSAGLTSGVRFAWATVVVRAEGPRTVVALRGEFDLSSRPALSQALSEAIASCAGDVVIDLAEVKFIDSSIVGALALSDQLLDRQGRTLTFRRPSKLATRVLRLFGLAGQIEGDPRAYT